MPANAKALSEMRADLIQKAQLYIDQHEDAQGLLSAEDQAAVDEMLQKATDLQSQIKLRNSLESASVNLLAPATGRIGANTANADRSGAESPSMISIRSGFDQHGKPQYRNVSIGKRGTSDYLAAFNKALVGGARSLSTEEYAALRSDDSSQAGYLVTSEQFATELLTAVDDLNFVRQYATIHPVREADSLGIRKRTNKANTFSWSSELSLGTADSTLAYGKKVLTPHHLTGRIKVSRDLVRRSILSVDSIVREELARDANEKMEDAYLVGTGSMQPLGVFVASSDGISTGRDINTGSATGFTADGLVAAKYALKQQYRNGGTRSGARWLFHRDGIKLISQLKDGDNHYMLQPARGLTGDEWDTLLGYPVDESERAPNTYTNGLYSGLLCNWRYYEIADALDVEIQVLDQLYAETNEIGYIGRLKTDGMPTLEEAFVRLKCAT